MPSLNHFWMLKFAAQSVSSQPKSQSKLKLLIERGKYSPFWSSHFFSSSETSLSRHCTSSSRFFPSGHTASPPYDSKMAASTLLQGKALTASEAVSRVLAIPSVNGPAWHSCSYLSCQLLIDKSETARARQSLDWNIATSRDRDWFYDLTAVLKWKLDGNLEGYLPPFHPLKAGEVWKEGRHVKKSCGLGLTLGEELGGKILKASLSDHSWELGGAKMGLHEHTNVSSVNASQLHHFVGGSIPSQVYRSLCGLPAVNDSIGKTVYNSSCSVAAFISSGPEFDRSQEEDRTENGERRSERMLNSGQLRLLSGVCCLPHPDKERTGGEDAYFICPDEQVIGVADGVGGWADVGVDAGEYARELMTQSMIAVSQEPHGLIDPARVLRTAHSKTTCRGSSTACILALSNHGLQAANLGDSGFIVVRNGRTIFKSLAQQHQFNIPFQLENGGSDPPSAAEIFNLEVAAGDVVIAGTDGLFDNLYNTELTGVIVHSIRAGLSPQITAEKIVSLARSRAQDRNGLTPFSLAAQDAGFRFYGGKMDDITVVVSYITSSKSPQEPMS